MRSRSTFSPHPGEVDPPILTVRPSRGSYVQLGIMALVFLGLGGFALVRAGWTGFLAASWLMKIAYSCIALPGPLLVITLILVAQVRLDVTPTSLVYRGPFTRWTLPLTELKGIVIHYLKPTGKVARIQSMVGADVPLSLAVLEFQTSDGRKCIRSMQGFQLDVDPQELVLLIEEQWSECTGEEELEVSSRRISFKDSWTLR